MLIPVLADRQKEWIPAIHSTGVEPCGNDERAGFGDYFSDLLKLLAGGGVLGVFPLRF